MRRIHIVGGKNQGKTTLVVDLVKHFLAQGLRVATIKHTHHSHELDTPGKDSYRHRDAGAEAVGIVANNMNAVFWPSHPEDRESEAKYDAFAALMDDCDVVLVEGDQHVAGLKVEVWRAELQAPPQALVNPTIMALASDDVAAVDVPVFPRCDLRPLGDYLLSQLALEVSSA